MDGSKKERDFLEISSRGEFMGFHLLVTWVSIKMNILMGAESLR